MTTARNSGSVASVALLVIKPVHLLLVQNQAVDKTVIPSWFTSLALKGTTGMQECFMERVKTFPGIFFFLSTFFYMSLIHKQSFLCISELAEGWVNSPNWNYDSKNFFPFPRTSAVNIEMFILISLGRLRRRCLGQTFSQMGKANLIISLFLKLFI